MSLTYELPTELPRTPAEERQLLQVGDAIHKHYVSLCLARVAQTVHAFLDNNPQIVELQLDVDRDGIWDIQYREMEDDNELSEPQTPEEWEAHTTMRKAFDQFGTDLSSHFDTGAFEALAQRYGQASDRTENPVWLTLADAQTHLNESLTQLRSLAPAPTPPPPSRGRSGMRR